MTAQDWEFLFELICRPPRNPQEFWQLCEPLRCDPFDRAQRAVLADYLYEQGYDGCAKLVRRGYVPGGTWGHDLDNVTGPGTFDLGSGTFASGSIGSVSVTSGLIYWPSIASGAYVPPLGTATMPTANSGGFFPPLTPPSGSAYEELDD